MQQLNMPALFEGACKELATHLKTRDILMDAQTVNIEQSLLQMPALKNL